MDYYQVRPKGNPEVYGCVMDRLRNEVEVLIGDSSVKELGLHVDDEELNCSEEYFVEKISAEEMNIIRMKAEEWECTQRLTDSCAGKISPLAGKTFPNGLF